MDDKSYAGTKAASYHQISSRDISLRAYLASQERALPPCMAVNSPAEFEKVAAKFLGIPEAELPPVYIAIAKCLVKWRLICADEMMRALDDNK